MPEHEIPFDETIRRFFDAGIRFVVIGGVAMGLQGSDLITKDVDFAYAPEPENLDLLAAFLPKIRARVLGRPSNDGFVIEPATLQKVRFLNLITDLGAVDVLREIPGVDSFEGLWERAVPIDFGGFVARVASLDDLIAMKRAANRPKDQRHLYDLLALKRVREEQDTKSPAVAELKED